MGTPYDEMSTDALWARADAIHEQIDADVENGDFTDMKSHPMYKDLVTILRIVQRRLWAKELGW